MIVPTFCTYLIMLLAFSCEYADGKIYPGYSQVNQTQTLLNIRNTSILSIGIGRNAAFVEDLVHCCASIFATVVVDLHDENEIENFVAIFNKSYSNGRNYELAINLVFSSNNIESVLEKVLKQTATFLSELRSIQVTRISLSPSKPLCTNSSSQPVLQISRAFQHLKTLFQSNKISLGLGIFSSDMACHHQLPLHLVDFIILKLNVNSNALKMSYTFDHFRSQLQPVIEAAIGQIKSLIPMKNKLFEIFVHPLSYQFPVGNLSLVEYLEYSKLQDRFTLRLGSLINQKLVISPPQITPESLNKLENWIHELVKLNDMNFDFVGVYSILQPHVNEEEQDAMLTALVKHTKVIYQERRLKISFNSLKNSSFFKLITKLKQINQDRLLLQQDPISLMVSLAISKELTYAKREQFLESVRILVDINKSVKDYILVKALIVIADDDFCTTDIPYFRNPSMHTSELSITDWKDTIQLLHSSKILVGLSDCEMRSGYTTLVDFVMLSVVNLMSYGQDEALKQFEWIRSYGETQFPNVPLYIALQQGETENYGDLNCLRFRNFHELAFNWAQVWNVTGVPIDAFKLSGWFKTVKESVPQEFIRRVDDMCVVINRTSQNSRINFSTNLAGMSVNLRLPNQIKIAAQLEIASMIELIFSRFQIVEIIGVKNELTESSKYLVKGLGNVRWKFKQDKLPLKLFINLGLLRPQSVPTRSLDEMYYSIVESDSIGTYSIAGVHFQLYMNEFYSQQEELLKSFKSRAKSINLRVGCMIVDIQWPFKFQTNVSTDIETLCDYLILDINVLQQIDVIINARDDDTNFESLRDESLSEKSAMWYPNVKQYERMVYELFEQFRVFRQNVIELRPGITVYLKLAWPTVVEDDNRDENGWKESAANFVQFWSFVNDFSIAYDFPYFINQAFDKSFIGAKSGRRLNFGWWTMDENSTDGFNLSKVFEKESEYLGFKTKRPVPRLKIAQAQAAILPTSITGLVGMVVILLIVGIIILFVKLHRKNQILAEEDFQYFLNGEEGSGKISLGKKNSPEEKILGNAYNAYQYEIRKSEIILETSEEIGRGQFGFVYKTAMARFDCEVAVKMPNPTVETSLKTIAVKSLLSEIKILSYIGEHCNILKFLGAYTKEVRKGIVFVITEYCELGSLLTYLQKCKLRVGNDKQDGVEDGSHLVNLYELNKFCYEIANGMEYISGKDLVHGDLAARNILLDKFRTCKISDFGLARKLERYGTYVKKGQEPLPWQWMAIESLERREFTIKSDVWACGVTFWEVFSLGNVPYPEFSWNDEFIHNIQQGLRLESPAHANKTIYATMTSCWSSEPLERPSFQQLSTRFQQQRNVEYTKL